MSTTEQVTINGIDYRVTHIEATQRDIIVITGMDDECNVKLGQLDICHDTESAWVEAQDGETFSVNTRPGRRTSRRQRGSSKRTSEISSWWGLSSVHGWSMIQP